MMHSFVLMAVVSVLWAVVGYSIAFGEGNSFFGGLQYLFLHGVGADPNADYAATIPQGTFMIYQLMFAIITPALISGAFAERMKFSGMLLFTILWTLFVYFPMAHMVWGKNGFLGATWGKVSTFDFAGGTVVHITSGVSALVCALYLGKRKGYRHRSHAPAQPGAEHRRRLPAVGGMVRIQRRQRAGGYRRSPPVPSSPPTSPLPRRRSGWMLVEWIKNGKPSILGGISGAVAGLVAITPASGFVTPMPAMLIGLIAGVVCYFMVSVVKSKFGYDDALDAFGVHGIGGTVGAILTGVFATKEINDLRMGKPMGLIDGNPGQVINNLIGALIAWGLAIVGTWIILKVCDAVTGVRADEQAEIEGLDLSMHGEEGYNFEA